MREIGELAAGVAHDFNNLLTVVMQTCSYLLRRHPVGDADYPMLREISDHATTAKELSEMLRAYARQQTFAREVFDVGDFIGSTPGADPPHHGRRRSSSRSATAAICRS